jgi:hypothetical protein
MLDDSQFRYSSLRENILEHLFVGELLRCLWRIGRRDIELLRAEVDFRGYDLALECNGCLRHIQLKSSHRGSAARSVNAQVALEDKRRSACIIWIEFDPSTMELRPFLWFGAKPGCPIPPLGDELARHTRADHTGTKGLRPNLRVIKKNRFRKLSTINEVARELFGAIIVALINATGCAGAGPGGSGGPSWLLIVFSRLRIWFCKSADTSGCQFDERSSSHVHLRPTRSKPSTSRLAA